MKNSTPSDAHALFLDTVGVRVDGKNVWRVKLPHSIICVSHAGAGRTPWHAFCEVPKDWTVEGIGATPAAALARYNERRTAELERLNADVGALANIIDAARA